MELKIYSPTEDSFIKAITWNNNEIKAEVAEKMAYYKDLYYDDTQIKDAKADRATLNKFVHALEEKGKEIKKQCLAPYEAFEAQVKEIMALVNEPIAMIDKQLAEYEEKRKSEKMDAIKTAFEALKAPDGLTLEAIFNSKWTNASYTLKKITEEMQTAIDKFNSDIATIANFPKYAFEAKEMYIRTLDINKALNEANRLSEMAKKKAEYEEKINALKNEPIANKPQQAIEKASGKEAADASGQAREEAVLNTEKAIKTDVTDKQWVGFKALLTVGQAKELKQFFDTNGIEFIAI